MGWVLACISDSAQRQYEAATGKQFRERFGVNDQEFSDFSKKMKTLAQKQAGKHATTR